jgi:hypothetical protein
MQTGAHRAPVFLLGAADITHLLFVGISQLHAPPGPIQKLHVQQRLKYFNYYDKVGCETNNTTAARVKFW